jgi:uncharacterized protein
LRSRGSREDEIREALSALNGVDDFVRGRVDRAQAQAALDRAWTRRWASSSPLPRHLPSASEIRSWVRWRDLDFDPLRSWERISAPVLLLYGAEDRNVPVDRNANRIAAALTRGGNSDVTLEIFPGADHEVMLPSGPGPDTGGRWRWPRPAPGYIEKTIEWVRVKARLQR